MMNEEGKELEVIRTEIQSTPLGDDQLLAVAEQAEKRIEAVKKIKRIALGITDERDWVNQGGKPYLAVSGAEKVARLFGISWRIDEPKMVHEEGGHYRFEYKGEFSMGTVSIEAVGIRSSKSHFFSRAHGEDVPVSEIDARNVKMAAYTNCIGNGITRLLGIRNLTWEDLEASGIDVRKIASVEYKTKEGTEKSATISEAQGRRLWKIAKERLKEQKVPETEHSSIIHMVIGEYGFKQLKDITRDKYDEIVEKLQNWELKDALADEDEDLLFLSEEES